MQQSRSLLKMLGTEYLSLSLLRPGSEGTKPGSRSTERRLIKLIKQEYLQPEQDRAASLVFRTLVLLDRQPPLSKAISPRLSRTTVLLIQDKKTPNAARAIRTRTLQAPLLFSPATTREHAPSKSKSLSLWQKH